jgi:hypothetical protein
MPDKRLSLPETALLIVLMAEAREIANPEIKERYGLTLDGKERRHLNELGLVDSWRAGRSFTHALTDDGWAWAANELEADRPPRGAGSAGGALYAVLGNLRRFLTRVDLQLADVFVQTAEAAPVAVAATDVESMVRAAYDDLASEPRAWVGLADLRSKLADVGRPALDEVLRQMNRLSDVTLAPESNQKALEARDREAAVTIGNQEKHLISIGA